MATIVSDPVQLAQALIRCESVTPAEGGALTVLEGWLSAAGFDVVRMVFSEPGTADVENLYARIGTARPNFCFAGHTDVVPPGDLSQWGHPPFAAVIADGVLFGRGAVDMKGAIACFVAAALDHLAAHGGQPKAGSISLLITGDEEGASINGTAKLLDWLQARGERLDFCLVGEPTNPKAVGDEIKIGRRGSLNVAVTVKGRQGHAAYPELADNPVPKLARIVAELSDLKLDMGSPHFAPSNIEVCVIGCSSAATNVIPAQANAAFNVRYNSNWQRPTIEAHVAATLERMAEAIGAELEVSFSGTGDVFLTAPGPFVTRVTDAVEAVTGRKPALTTAGGTSDARFIQAYCPVVEFGLTNATIHAINENTPIKDLYLLRDVYRAMLERA
ncbi:MAG: succinyl-diaminopimelate desuccinylase [Hyphomicrobiaceae bacterium]